MRRLFVVLLLLCTGVVSLAQVPEMPDKPMPERYLTLMPRVSVSRVKNNLVFDVVCTDMVSSAYLTVGFLPRPDALRPTYRRDSSATPAAKQFNLKVGLGRLKGHFTGDRSLLYYKLNLTDEKGRPESYQSRILLDGEGNPVNTVIHGPYLDRPEPDNYVISLELLEPDAATIVMDGKAVVSAQKQKRHEIPVGALAPGKHQYTISGDPRVFDVEIRDKGPFRFAVMSDSRSVAGGAEFNQQAVNGRVLGDLFLDAYHRNIDLVVFPGDLVDGYTQKEDEFERELKSWAWISEPVAARVPVFEGIGNHEALVIQYADNPYIFFDRKPPHSTEDVFARVFVNPTHADFSERDGLPSYRENLYYFHMRDCLFVMANSNYWVGGKFPEKHGGNLEGHIMDKQMAWLEQVLKTEGPKAKRIFFFTHEPAYPVSAHMKDGMWYWGGDPKRNRGIDRRYIVERRDELMRLLDRYNVRLMMFGDEHNYSRVEVTPEIGPVKQPITQIITGGAGAPYYELADEIPWRDNIRSFGRENHFILVEVDDTVRVQAIGITGVVLDTFELK